VLFERRDLGALDQPVSSKRGAVPAIDGLDAFAAVLANVFGQR
jgi:hypothetical protein